MPLNLALASVLCLSFLLAACGKEPPAPLFTGVEDNTSMDAAIATAKSEVDEFIAKFEAGDGEHFSVKAPVADGEHVEHFWLGEITFEDGVFEGIIENEPGKVGNVEFGQKYSIHKDDISDWLYLKEGKIHGNYTLRVLLDTMPPAEAAASRALLAE